MKNTITKEDFQSYFDRGWKVVPIGEDKKGYGKMPLLNNWQNLPWSEMGDPYDIIDNWYDRLGDKITGLGILMGSVNHHICCIDIDTNDEEIVNKICKYFHTKVKKRGGKGWTLFFISDGKNNRNYYKFECPGNLGIIEVFYSNRQIVIPPSWYSGEKLYTWEDDFCTLLTIEPEDLPVLPTEWVENIGSLIGSPTTAVANLNLPKSSQFKDGQNRTIAINGLVGRIFKNNPHPDVNNVCSELLTYDATHFPDNSFFLDPRKAHNKTTSRSINCMAYVSAIAATLYRNSGAGIEFDSPVESETIVFNKLMPVTEAHFRKDTDEPPEFDKSLIPDCWRSMIDTISDGQCTPPHAVFMAMMTSLGACLQGNTVITPLKGETFFRRTNLATAMVANSGSKKSDVVRQAIYEVKKIDKLLKKSNSREDLERVKDIENKIEMLTKAKKREPGDTDKINEEIYKLQDELENNPLKGTKFLYENAPIQKMIYDAKMNQKTGFLIIKDEMKQIFSDFKKKGNEDARTFYMKGFDATDVFSYSTLSRGDDIVEKHVLSLLTNVQPDVLSAYIKSLYSAYGENDGFLQRIILVPFGTPILRKPKAVDFTRFTKQYEVFNRAFYSQDITAMIDSSVEDYYRDLRYQIQLKALKMGNDPVAAFFSKHEGLLCVFGYLYEFLNSEEKPIIITKESLDKAMALLSYLGECAKHLFNIKDRQQDHDIVVQVAGMLCNRHFTSGSTQSEMYQQLRGAIKFPVSFYSALKDLELRGYVKTVETKSNSSVVHINPLVYTL